MCQCLHWIAELGEKSDENGGRLIDWQEGFFGGVSGIEFIFYSAVVPVRETQLKFPFAVSCNFLKVFSLEECRLDLCLGPKLEFRCCVLCSGSLNLHFFCCCRNCIFNKHFWQTDKVVISPEFRGVSKIGFYIHIYIQHPKNHPKLFENSVTEIDTQSAFAIKSYFRIIL